MNCLALFGNLMGPDMLLILFIMLLLFGAKKLPELARGLGQAVKEFGKAKDDVTNEIQRAAHYDPHHYTDHNHPPQPQQVIQPQQPPATTPAVPNTASVQPASVPAATPTEPKSHA